MTFVFYVKPNTDYKSSVLENQRANLKKHVDKFSSFNIQVCVYFYVFTRVMDQEENDKLSHVCTETLSELLPKLHTLAPMYTVIDQQTKKDFYQKYLDKNMSQGSTIDLCKILLMCNDGSVNELVMDTNTIINNYQALVESTFTRPEQNDAYAVYFYIDHLNINNKTIYFTANTSSRQIFQKRLDTYVSGEGEKPPKNAESNCIFEQVFRRALVDIGLSIKKSFGRNKNDDRFKYHYLPIPSLHNGDEDETLRDKVRLTKFIVGSMECHAQL